MNSNEKTKIIPGTFNELDTLKELSLDDNHITDIVPDSFNGLEKLLTLSLDCNRITEIIPGAFNGLNNLEELSLDINCITEINHNIFNNLVSVSTIRLFGNRIKEIKTGTFCDLTALSTLKLSENKIETIQEGSFKLNSNISKLYLSKNKLSFLPKDFIETCWNLQVLDLENNKICSKSKNGEITRNEIISYYKKELKIDPINFQYPLNEEEVYENLKKTKIYWNLEKLKTLKMTPIPKVEWNELQLIDILETVKHFSSNENYEIIKLYIQKLFNPESEYSKLPMHPDYVPLTINLLGNILEALIVKNDSDWCNLILNTICLGLEECHTRQLSELNSAYFLLFEMVNTPIDLNSFIISTIGFMKEQAFDHIIAEHDSDQNVHLLSFWKDRMQEKLGLVCNFNDTIGIQNEDPFDDEDGTVLEAFFKNFKLENVIKELTLKINSNSQIFCELAEKIEKDTDLSLNDMDEMGLLLEQQTYCLFESINEKAIEYILLKMNVICKNNFENEIKPEVELKA